jgi:SAM-dependent methyltransferase
MIQLPAFHLSIVQPIGYAHSLGFVDQVRYVRWQLRRLGARVTVAKNRLREDAVNLVFGAHLGFDPERLARHTCVFVNLEQLGEGGAQVSEDYLRLLRNCAVIDYDPHNVAAYAEDPADVPVIPLLHAPYLDQGEGIPLEERPIDLLFIGSINPRRQALIDRIQSLGHTVSTFDGPIYGDDRDAFIRQAKAVLNVHFYESSRFEQARVSHCLSLGTPVISERGPATRPHDAFEDSVLWLQDEAEFDHFFRHDFLTPAYYDAVRAGLERFRAADPIDAYADMAVFCSGVDRGERSRRVDAPWQPTLVNLGSGKDYQPGWLNLDVLERAEPDLVLDLCAPLTLPLSRETRFGGRLFLEEGSVDIINANNVLEHVSDLPALMGNCLRLLSAGGEMRIEVPYEGAPTAWQDPTHVRALNQNSWIYYTDWFWYLGWYEHRFEIAESAWLDASVQPCDQAKAAFMRIVLRKVETTPHERLVARTFQTDLRLPEDAVPASAIAVPLLAGYAPAPAPVSAPVPADAVPV